MTFQTSSYNLISGLGTIHHPVSTSNPQAQEFFDQGLNLIYAFNHDKAVRSFQYAVKLDPHLAIAYWGIALALGPQSGISCLPSGTASFGTFYPSFHPRTRLHYRLSKNFTLKMPMLICIN